jgi:predicted  nucleic acid-binding Zn-ribbon protein
MKQQINNAYDVDNVLVLENELTHNRQIIDDLMSQNKGLKNVKRGHNLAMKRLNHDTDANQRLDNIKHEVVDLKKEVRDKIEKIRTKEKDLQEKQKHMVDLEERYRKLQMLLLKNKQRSKRK